MRARLWVFAMGLLVGLIPSGILGEDPGALRWLLAGAGTLGGGIVLAGLFDDGSVRRASLVAAATAGVAVLPLTTLLVEWG